jgi:hypothetical protein
MRLKRRGRFLKTLFIGAFFAFFAPFAIDIVPCHAAWDAGDDVRRLSKEVPSIAAFPEAGMVWLSSYNYSMRPDGSMEKRHRFLMLLNENGADETDKVSKRDKRGRFALAYPFEIDPSAEITEAQWLDRSSGEKMGELETEMTDGGPEIFIPAEATGGVIAIETVTAGGKQYYLDDLVTLAGPFPAWEQRVEVAVPEGMDCYWQGTGVRSPERRVDMGLEHIVWTAMNQPAWHNSGILDRYPPTLVFSLRRGLAAYLRDLRNLENSFAAPPIPSEIPTSGGPQRAIDGIAAYMKDRLIPQDGPRQSAVRIRGTTAERGPWTPWEGTIIAGKWLESMGYSVRVFWSQRYPVGTNGPDAMAVWREPLLAVNNGGSDVYFVAGRAEGFGKLPPHLFGASVYRFDGSGVQRIVLPKGNASDHTLTQQWRLSIGEDGIASGSLDITATGGWASVLSGGKRPAPEGAGGILREISFFLPGMNIEPISVRPVANGFKANFSVRVPLGIVSGGDILMRMPGGLPVSFEDIPRDREGFTFGFPFVFEQDVIVSTPKGYRSFSLPGKTQHGDSRAGVEESIVHWEKRSQIEASSKWTVRSPAIDSSLAGRILDQLALARRWTETTVPLRK